MGHVYFEFSTATDPEGPVPITEARFIELRNQADQFDLFLWVSGPNALAGRRDVRTFGAGGPFERTSTPGCPGRLPDDAELRATSARTMLAVMRSGDWMTPIEAFRAGNPHGANPSPSNAFATMAKGRRALDFERGHEAWESFELQRKNQAAADACLRFKYCAQNVPSLGDSPVPVRWCATWSVTNSESSATAASAPRDDATPVEAAPVEDLPMWDARRKPQLISVLGLEIIVRDALIHVEREEAVLLLTVRDSNHAGPFLVEHVAFVVERQGGSLKSSGNEGLYPGARIAVPGQVVVRLRTRGLEVPRDGWIDWGCVAFRETSDFSRPDGAAVEREVMFTVRQGTERTRCIEKVMFRVVGV